MPHTLLRGAAVWLLIAVAETVHGTVRTLWLLPLVGDLRSRQIGVLTGSVMILLIAWATIRWIGARETRQLLGIGALWVILMLAFEAGLGRALGMPWERLLSDYNPWKGGFMLAGLAVLGLAPLIGFRLRARR